MNLQSIIPKNGPAKEEVQKYIKKYVNEIIVIKCGGSVLLNPNLFNQFIEDISVINKLGLNVIVVHGGGKIASELARKMDITVKMTEGRRITDAST